MRKTLALFLSSYFSICFLIGHPTKKTIYENHIYESQIRSTQLYTGESELNYPILGIGKSGALTLEFDELGKNPSQNISMSVIHCEADWTPSDLFISDFFDGFINEPLQNFNTSRASRNPYTHYFHKFPTNGTFKMSGNYLLKVYRNNDENDLLITRRFIVTEQLLNLQTDLGFTPNVGNRYEVQSVNFYLFKGNIDINDPFSPVNVCVMQNFRWETMRKNLKPAYILPEKSEYRFSAENDFEGGNEFRWFDVRNVIQRVNRARVLTMTDTGMFVQLDPDKPRTFKQYTSEPDFNGNFFTGSKQFPDQDLEADYVHVKLTLQIKEPITDGDVYIYGAISDWKPYQQFKMKYNQEEGHYEKTLLLKQGVYNYQYGVWNPKWKESKFDEQRFEGNHFETENYYTVIVYYKGPSDRATRIIGIRHVNYYE